MNTRRLTKALIRVAGKAAMMCRKNAPEMLIGAATVFFFDTVVKTSKAAGPAAEVVKDTAEKIDDIQEVLKKKKDTYTAKDAKKDVKLVYMKSGLKMIKIYAPVVFSGGLALGCMFTSNSILRNRNLALTAAYTAVSTTFGDYRRRVIDKYGEKIDNELRYNIVKQKIDEVTVDPETGKTKKSKKIVEAMDEKDLGQYDRFFDELSRCYKKDAFANGAFLTAQQNYFNNLLRDRGYVFLNEVYDALDLRPSKEGQIVGWFYDRDDKNAPTDPIDFGIYDIYRTSTRRFAYGYEPAVMLRFNVQGPIMDKIKW